jgi:hypothetical protein
LLDERAGAFPINGAIGIEHTQDDTVASEVHFAALASSDSPMRFRNPRVFMGGTFRPPEYAVEMTRASDVAAVVQAVAQGI